MLNVIDICYTRCYAVTNSVGQLTRTKDQEMIKAKKVKAIKVDSIVVVNGREWRVASKQSNFRTGSPNAHERADRAHWKATFYILWLADDVTGESIMRFEIPVDASLDVKVAECK